MTRDRGFVERVLGLLLPLGPVGARAMFGGWGLYLDDVMFALIAGDRLYLKVDPETKFRFVEAGAKPFTYTREDRRITMSYREAPAAALDDPEVLLPWAQLALEAARRNRGKRMRRSRAR